MPGSASKYESGGVVVAIGAPSTVELAPHIFHAVLTGDLFEAERCFVVPAALPTLRALVTYLGKHAGAKVLLVGHGDDAAGATARTKALAELLTGDIDAWLARYQSGWGLREDQHMLASLDDGKLIFYTGRVDGLNGPLTRAGAKRFQAHAKVAVDGVIGPITRRALITAYFARPGTQLPAGAALEHHACTAGAEHPVEAFVFERAIEPPPQTCAAPGCAERPQWLAHTIEKVELPEDELVDLRLRLFDRLGEPLAGAPFEAVVAGKTVKGTADGSGFAVVEQVAPASSCELRWSRPGVDAGEQEFEFIRTVNLDVADSGDASARERLTNLGYTRGSGPLADDVRWFQEDYELPINGDPRDPAFAERLREVHDRCDPKRFEPERPDIKTLIPEE